MPSKSLTRIAAFVATLGFVAAPSFAQPFEYGLSIHQASMENGYLILAGTTQVPHVFVGIPDVVTTRSDSTDGSFYLKLAYQPSVTCTLSVQATDQPLSVPISGCTPA